MPHDNDRMVGHVLYTMAGEDIFRDLTPEQHEAITRRINYVDYSAGHTFYAPEELSDQLWILRTGRVRIYKLSPEGRALTLLVLEPIAVFGEMMLVDRWAQDSFAEAIVPCTVGQLGRLEFLQVLERHPAVALRLMDVMSRRLRALENKLADVSFKSVPQRLATVLLSLADIRPGEPIRNTPPAVVRYTHQQLAEMIGSYRETVTKAIGEFREAGMIRVEEETIHLTDTMQLQALVGRV